jgi:hypothetical protein
MSNDRCDKFSPVQTVESGRTGAHHTTTQGGAEAAAAPVLSCGCRFSVLNRVDIVTTLYYNTFAAE